MAIEKIKQELSQGEKREKPEKMPTPKPQPEKKDTSIFGGKAAIPMGEAAWKIRKASPYIPGSGGKMFSENERIEMGQELAKKYGGYLKKAERYRIFNDLEKEKRGKTLAEKLKIDQKIKYFKGLLEEK